MKCKFLAANFRLPGDDSTSKYPGAPPILAENLSIICPENIPSPDIPITSRPIPSPGSPRMHLFVKRRRSAYHRSRKKKTVTSVAQLIQIHVRFFCKAQASPIETHCLTYVRILEDLCREVAT